MEDGTRTIEFTERYILVEGTDGIVNSINSSGHYVIKSQKVLTGLLEGELFEKDNSKEHDKSSTKYTFVSTEDSERSMICREYEEMLLLNAFKTTI